MRRYTLTYEAALSSTGRSRLQSVQECAGVTPDCYTATSFTYQNGTSGLGAEVSTGTTIATAAGLLAIDFNGDLRTDIVYPSTNNGTGYWTYRTANPGAGAGFNTAVTTTVNDANASTAIAIDHNHDGRDDVLAWSGSQYRAIRLNPSWHHRHRRHGGSLLRGSRVG